MNELASDTRNIHVRWTRAGACVYQVNLETLFINSSRALSVATGYYWLHISGIDVSDFCMN